MNQSKLRKFIILSLLFIEILFMILSVKSFSNRNIKKIKETYKVDKKTFLMYVENDNGKYSEYISSNMFPEGYQINLTKSSCIDTKGNTLSGILSGNKNNVTVISNKTAYCYIYFDIDRPATEELIATVPEEQLWDSTLEDDGYRYVGTNPDNYICFGTTDQEECMNDTDKYMYRIIGIFEDEEGKQHLKLIKKEALNTAYAWNADYQTDVDWDESDLYKGLNGSYFVTNKEYSYMQDSAWNNIITTWEYTATNTRTYEKNGVFYSDDLNVKDMYLHELNRISKTNSIGEWKMINSKIGVMYISDYMLSLGLSSLEYMSWINRETLKTGWMHISNNDSVDISASEWTMTRYGNSSSGVYYSYHLDGGGNVGINWVGDFKSLRPVFYLESDTKLDKGTGTIDNPYIIEISPNLREYCEEYNNINECIKNEENNIEEVSDLWKSTLEDDGYRYVGTDPNNYVCFGYINATEDCDFTSATNTDLYAYRIIGIFEDEEGQQHLKLIKKEALNTSYAWHSDATIDIDWNVSDLYKGLNGSYFLTNTTYMPSGWTDKIATWKWTATNTQTYYKYDTASSSSVSNVGAYYYYSWPVGIYNSEHEINTTTGCQTSSGSAINCKTTATYTYPESKISLMYASDYALSLGATAVSMMGNTYTNRATLKTGWMHISNNDSGAPSTAEWTSSRYGFNGYSYFAWFVPSTGFVSDYDVDLTSSVRPVFYLTAEVELSGEGTIGSPYIIS